MKEMMSMTQTGQVLMKRSVYQTPGQNLEVRAILQELLGDWVKGLRRGVGCLFLLVSSHLRITGSAAFPPIRTEHIQIAHLDAGAMRRTRRCVETP